MRDHPEPVQLPPRDAGTRAVWLVVLAGPVAWLLDESIALVIEARLCGGPLGATPAFARPLLAVVAAAAIVMVGTAMLGARRAIRAADRPAARSRRDERMRFMALGGVMIGTLALFGIVLRLVASLVSPTCA
jgi:hypothetical protein